MKALLITLMILNCTMALCQTERKEVHIDTVRYGIAADGRIVFPEDKFYRFKQGINFILDTLTGLEMRGVIKKKYSLKQKLSIGFGKHMVQVDLWTYSRNDTLLRYVNFDKRGVIQGEVRLYPNGNIHTEFYSTRRKKDTFFQEYLEDGSVIHIDHDTLFLDPYNGNDNWWGEDWRKK